MAIKSSCPPKNLFKKQNIVFGSQISLETKKQFVNIINLLIIFIIKARPAAI